MESLITEKVGCGYECPSPSGTPLKASPESPKDQQFPDAENLIDDFSLKLECDSELQARISVLQQEKLKDKEEVDRLRKENSSLKKTLNEYEVENLTLKATIEELRKKAVGLEKENARLTFENEKVSTHQSNSSFYKYNSSVMDTNTNMDCGSHQEMYAESLSSISENYLCKNRVTISPHLDHFEFRATTYNNSPFKKSQSMANAGEVAVFLRNKSISDNIMEQFSFSPNKSKKDLSASVKDYEAAHKAKLGSKGGVQIDKGYLEGLTKSLVFGNVNPSIEAAGTGGAQNPTSSSIGSLKSQSKKPPVKLDCKEIRSRTLTNFKGLKFKPKRLFEDFMLMGIDRETILNYLLENPKELKGNVPGKILWNFKSQEAIVNTPKQSMQDFVFPFGVKIRDCTNEKQEMDRIYQRLSSEKERLQSMKMTFPLLPWDDDVLTGDWDTSVEQMNEHHLIYFVCLITNDYITLDQADMLRIDPETKFEGIRVFEVKTAICFMTYYPIISFFQDLLKCISNQLRHFRREKFLSDQRDLRKYDLDSWTEISNEFLKKTLQVIYEQCPVPECGTKLQVALNNYPQYPLISNFSIPPVNEAFSVESLWGSYIVFSYLSLKDIKWLLSAILLERKLIFLSKNMTLLTSTMSVLITLIKPFLYTFPIIFSVPELLLGLCDAPGAGIMGINKSEDYFWSEDMINLYPSCVFVFLDSKKVYALEETKVAKMPVFSDFDVRLRSAYHEINSSSDEIKKFMSMSQILKVKMKDETQLEKVSKQSEASDSKKYFRSQVIFMLVRITWKEKIVALIENEAREKNPSFEKVSKDIVGQYFYSVNKDFLKEFTQSQILRYFFQTMTSKK